MKNTPYIEVLNLKKTFKNVVAVNKLSFTVNKGDIYGFLGPNGAGKSTTIRVLLSLIQPDTGQINFFGNDFYMNRQKILKNIGALVEKPDFYPYLTAYENLKVLASYSGFDITQNKIFEILELVGLKNRHDSKVKTYSQGMKQRLGLAQAIMHNPDIIILDEPVNGLDPQGTRDIRKLILHLNKNENKTIFLSSHLLSEIEQIANRMLIINKGKKIVEGGVDELLNEDMINVTFELDNTKEAREVIQKSRLNSSILSIEKNELKLKLEKDNINEVNLLFIQNEIKVHAIKPVRALEEYFLKLTDNNIS